MSTIPISNTPSVNELWAGIGGHFDALDQIINEFIDNSMSNFLGNSIDAKKSIEVTLKESNDKVVVSIEDSGTGIKNLDAAFTLGGRTCADSPLNEHGFGMKHAIASANPENDDWAIYTRTIDDFNNNVFKIIKAPYKLDNFEAEIVSCSEVNWPGNVNGSGTFVIFSCSKEMYWTLGRGIRGGYRDFNKLADILCEDLGFTYSNLIISNSASITLRVIPSTGTPTVRGVGAVQPDWRDLFAPGKGVEKYDLGNGEIQIQYAFGRINNKQPREGHEFDNSYARKHYKISMSSSGVEIRINGRVLTYNLFTEIWGLEKHNSYNDLLIIVDLKSQESDKLPKTRTSKNGIREGDKLLESLYSWIRGKYPTPVKNTSLSNHEVDLFEQLKDNMTALLDDDSGKVITTEMHVFTRTGSSKDKVRIDLYKNYNGKITIYEGKKDSTSSQDVYQLRMYWDGLVYDGIKPDEAILVASKHPDSVKNLVSIVNTMKDVNDNNYNIKTKTWLDLGIKYDHGNLD